MRIVLASLLATAAAIGAFVSVAQAQTPAAQPAPAAQTPAPAPAAPATAAPSTPPAATPDATAAPAAPAAPAAEAPPAVPTTGDGAQIIQLVEKFCVPLVRGGNFDQLAKANGMKSNRRDGSWSVQLGTVSRDYSVTFSAPGVNKDVCRGEVHYAVGQDKPIVEAINIWSFLHQPELLTTANYVAVDPDGVKRVRKSWEHFDAASSIGINFSTWTKPDDSSLNAKYSTGEIYYQERKLG